jgi:hypothetical protein
MMRKIDSHTPSEWIKDDSLVLVVTQSVGDGTVETRHLSYVTRDEDGKIWPAWPPIPDDATAEIVTQEQSNG